MGEEHGYENFLEASQDSDHEEHENVKGWVGGLLDPKHFSADSVVFNDPEERWNFALNRDIAS